MHEKNLRRMTYDWDSAIVTRLTAVEMFIRCKMSFDFCEILSHKLTIRILIVKLHIAIHFLSATTAKSKKLDERMVLLYLCRWKITNKLRQKLKYATLDKSPRKKVLLQPVTLGEISYLEKKTNHIREQ